MVFRMLQNGARKDLNVFATRRPIRDRSKEIWDNFMGAPSVYFVFAVPQDGITAPADFNASHQRLPEEHLERYGDRHIGGHADRSRRGRLLHRDADRA